MKRASRHAQATLVLQGRGGMATVRPSRALSYAPATRRTLSMVLVKAEPGTDLQALKRRIEAETVDVVRADKVLNVVVKLADDLVVLRVNVRKRDRAVAHPALKISRDVNLLACPAYATMYAPARPCSGLPSW